MDNRSSFSGIDGLQSRAPLAVAVSLGVKGARGQPEDTRRFFVVNARANGKGQTATRALHPDFAPFNVRMSRDTPEGEAQHAKRTVIQGTLIHASREECARVQLAAARIVGHQHPNYAPSCEGNGVQARRFYPAENQYKNMACPNDRCPYRARTEGKPPICKPYGLVIFQIRFQNMPCLPAKFSTGAWETCANIQGFFDDIERQAAALGVAPSFYGIPFRLHVSERSNPEKRTKWPVVDMATDFPSGQTLQNFLLTMASERRTLAESGTLLLPGSVRTAAEEVDDDEAISADLGGLSAGNIGSES